MFWHCRMPVLKIFDNETWMGKENRNKLEGNNYLKKTSFSMFTFQQLYPQIVFFSQPFICLFFRNH